MGALRTSRFFVVVICLLATGPLRAEVLIIESRSAGQNFHLYTDATNNPSEPWRNTAAKSIAAGVTPGIGSRVYDGNSGASFTLQPILRAGESYLLEITHGDFTEIPLDLEVSILLTGATGLPSSTRAFDRTTFNAWEPIGFLHLDPGATTPTVRFSVGATAGAFNADAFRFTSMPEPLAFTNVFILAIWAVSRRRANRAKHI